MIRSKNPNLSRQRVDINVLFVLTDARAEEQRILKTSLADLSTSVEMVQLDKFGVLSNIHLSIHIPLIHVEAAATDQSPSAFAVLEQLVAARSDIFMGNFWSTFSGAVQEERFRLQRSANTTVWIPAKPKRDGSDFDAHKDDGSYELLFDC